MAFSFAAAFVSILATTSPSISPTTVSAVATADQQTVPEMAPAELRAAMNANVRLVIVDVREPGEYAQGHIGNATLIPLGTLAARYQELPKGVKIVVYCRSGHRSAQAVTFLLAHGYSRAVSLKGGYMAWSGT